MNKEMILLMNDKINVKKNQINEKDKGEMENIEISNAFIFGLSFPRYDPVFYTNQIEDNKKGKNCIYNKCAINGFIPWKILIVSHQIFVLFVNKVYDKIKKLSQK